METLDVNAQLQHEIESLKAELLAQATQIAKMEILIKYYEEQFLLAKRRQFGSSSEQSPNQLRFENLFNEAEDQADPSLPEPTYEEITYKRKKRVGKRDDDLSGLPVERIDYEIPIPTDGISSRAVTAIDTAPHTLARPPPKTNRAYHYSTPHFSTSRFLVFSILSSTTHSARRLCSPAPSCAYRRVS